MIDPINRRGFQKILIQRALHQYFFLDKVLNIIFFICILCGGAFWRQASSGEWGIFVSMTGFWVTGILLLFYLVRYISYFL
jgi:hypothetical protein